MKTGGKSIALFWYVTWIFAECLQNFPPQFPNLLASPYHTTEILHGKLDERIHFMSHGLDFMMATKETLRGRRGPRRRNFREITHLGSNATWLPRQSRIQTCRWNDLAFSDHRVVVDICPCTSHTVAHQTRGVSHATIVLNCDFIKF